MGPHKRNKSHATQQKSTEAQKQAKNDLKTALQAPFVVHFLAAVAF